MPVGAFAKLSGVCKRSSYPGIGGTFTRFGHVEVLYVTELIGLLVIWVGYRLNTRVLTGAIEPERIRPAMSVGGAV